MPLTVAYVVAFVAGVFVEPFLKDLALKARVHCRTAKANAALPKNHSKSGIVDHPQLRNIITKYLTSNHYGLYVLGGPGGSGKSTMLGVAIDEFRSKDSSRIVLYLSNGSRTISEKTLKRELGIAQDRSISNSVQPGTIVIIDQVEMSEVMFRPSIEGNYLEQLSQESYTSQKFRILVVISDPEVMKAVLFCQGELINLLCPPALLQWNVTQVQELLRDRFDHWTDTERTRLTEALAPSYLPGVVDFVAESCRGTIGVPRQDIVQLAANCVAVRGDEWGAFECMQYE